MKLCGVYDMVLVCLLIDIMLLLIDWLMVLYGCVLFVCGDVCKGMLVVVLVLVDIVCN